MMNHHCLVPQCEDTIYARGLCHKDYQTAGILVRSGQTTWEILIAKGKALAAKGTGPFSPHAHAARTFFLEDK